jgi:hypothetical protein
MVPFAAKVALFTESLSLQRPDISWFGLVFGLVPLLIFVSCISILTEVARGAGCMYRVLHRFHCATVGKVILACFCLELELRARFDFRDLVILVQSIASQRSLVMSQWAL